MNRSLLIVAGDPDELDIHTRRFSLMGYQVTAAHRRRQALAAVTLHLFQVAIVNHTLSEIDGIELARRLRAQRDGLQVIVLTSAPDAVPRARAARAAACLLKPCIQAVLEATVEDLCERRGEETRLPAEPAAAVLT
jgi:DNA-binding response OmpR family regulator